MTDKIGRYIIRSEIGRGGFGRVYRAFDPNVNRDVAIKILVSQADADQLARFVQEAGMTGKLLHKNIVTVYEFDHQDRMPYLVMELLEGRTLQQLIEHPDESIGLLEKAGIMQQVAEGLRFAHSKGVIHRDIKPGNIMVLPDGTAKIMDFGIGRAMEAGSARRTQQGFLVGTVEYMAPEQFKSVDANERTDNWAFGTVFYELLTGGNPWNPGHSLDMASIMYRVVSHQAPALETVLPGCPPELDALVSRLLDKNPHARVELEDVILDLHPILQNLRQERAARLAAGIEPLAAADEIEKALVLVKEVLDLDNLNAEARRWRRDLQQRKEARAVRLRAEELLRTGKDHLRGRRLEEAIAAFEAAAQLDSTLVQVAPLLDGARAALQRIREAAALVAAARAEAKQGSLESALDKASRATDMDASNAEAPALRDHLAVAIRERAEAAALARADELRGIGDHDSALAELERVEPGSRLAAKAVALRLRIEIDRTEAERRRRAAALEGALAQVRTALYEQRFEDALEAAEAACAQFPDEGAAEDLLFEVREHQAAHRRSVAVAHIGAEASVLVEAERFDDARAKLEAGLASYPGDAVLDGLLQNCNTLQAAHRRAKMIDAIVLEAEELGLAREFEFAAQLIDSAIAKYGEEPVMLRCRKRLEETQDQVEAEARRAQAARLVGQLAPLIESEEFDRAQTLIVRVLDLDPDNEDGKRWREELHRRNQAKALRSKAAELVREGREHLAAERFAEAAAALEAAANLDESDPEAAALLDTARTGLERVEQVGSLMAEAKQHVLQGDLEAALAKTREAVDLDPANAAARAFGDRIEREIKDRNARAVLAQAEELRRGGDFMAALQTLDAIPEGSTLKTTAHVLRSRVEAERSAEERRVRAARLDAGLARIREALYSQQLEPAEALAKALSAEYPEEPLCEDLLAEVQERIAVQRRLKAVAEASARANALLAQDRFAEARAVLEGCMHSYPGEADLERLLESAAAAEAARARSAGIASALEQVHALAKERRYSAAFRILDSATEQFGPDSSLSHARQNLQSEKTGGAAGLEEDTLDDALAAFVATVRQCFADNDPTEAEWQLMTCQSEFGATPEWQALWNELQRRQSYDGRLDMARAARKAGDYASAVQILRDLLVAAPGDEVVRRLANVVTAEYEAHEAVQRGLHEAALLEASDPKRAVDMLAALLETYPANQELRARHTEYQARLAQAAPKPPGGRAWHG